MHCARRSRRCSANHSSDPRNLWGYRLPQFAEARSSAPGRDAMEGNRERAWSPWYLLLLIQFIPALWVPLYNRVEPTLGGMPFFYWFQLALVFVSAAVTGIVYFATEKSRNEYVSSPWNTSIGPRSPS